MTSGDPEVSSGGDEKDSVEAAAAEARAARVKKYVEEHSGTSEEGAGKAVDAEIAAENEAATVERTKKDAEIKAKREALEAKYRADNPGMTPEELEAAIDKAMKEADPPVGEEAEDPKTPAEGAVAAAGKAAEESGSKMFDAISTGWSDLVRPIGQWAADGVIKLANKQADGKSNILEDTGLWFMDIGLRIAVGNGGQSASWLEEYNREELDALESLTGMKVRRDDGNGGKAALDKDGGITVEWVDPDPSKMPAYKAVDVFEHTFGFGWSINSPVKDVTKDMTYEEFLKLRPAAAGKSQTRFDDLVAQMTAANEGKALSNTDLVVTFIENNADKLKETVKEAPVQSYDEVLKASLIDIGQNQKLSELKIRLDEKRAAEIPDGDPNNGAVLSHFENNLYRVIETPTFIGEMLMKPGQFSVLKTKLGTTTIEGVDLTKTEYSELDGEGRKKVIAFLQSDAGKEILKDMAGDMTLADVLEISKKSENRKGPTSALNKLRSHFEGTLGAPNPATVDAATKAASEDAAAATAVVAGATDAAAADAGTGAGAPAATPPVAAADAGAGAGAAGTTPPVAADAGSTETPPVTAE